MESILNTIKQMLGLEPTYAPFDPDVIVHINMAISTLTQVGVGPQEGFKISGSTETWNQFIGDDPRLIMVQEYIFLQTKINFDPPANSFTLSAYQEKIKELEWRLNVQVDKGE